MLILNFLYFLRLRFVFGGGGRSAHEIERVGIFYQWNGTMLNGRG